MRATLLTAATALAFVFAGCAAPVERPEDPAADGRARFVANCATCHGPTGLGDGPMSASLDPKPADLTRIAARAGGEFDAERVAAYIDGRAPLTAPKSSAMPVWGREYDDRNSHFFEEMKLDPVAIRRIVAYLETLQRP